MPTNRTTTPDGALRYLWADKPRPSEQYGDAYEATLVLPEDEAQTLIKLIDEEVRVVREANFVEADKVARLPYKRDEATGSVSFSFKLKAQGKKKGGGTYEAKPPVLTTQDGKPVPAGFRFGRNCRGSVIFDPFAYWSEDIGLGCSLRLRGIIFSVLDEYQSAPQAPEPDFDPADYE